MAEYVIKNGSAALGEVPGTCPQWLFGASAAARLNWKRFAFADAARAWLRETIAKYPNAAYVNTRIVRLVSRDEVRARRKAAEKVIAVAREVADNPRNVALRALSVALAEYDRVRKGAPQ